MYIYEGGETQNHPIWVILGSAVQVLIGTLGLQVLQVLSSVSLAYPIAFICKSCKFIQLGVLNTVLMDTKDCLEVRTTPEAHRTYTQNLLF